MSELFAAIGAFAVPLCLGVLAGAALGYYSAMRDAADLAAAERAEAFDAGLDAAWSALGPEARATYYATHAELLSDDEEPGR